MVINMNKNHLEAQAVEDEMSVTWEEGNPVSKLPEGAEIKKIYFEQPYRYQDVCQIWALTNGQFIVYYSPTGAKHLFKTWGKALSFRQGRCNHMRATYNAFRGW